MPFVHDLGSGALVDLARYGLRPEPTVREALAEGADLVTFSGDKLLGGPQAGIVAGAQGSGRARRQEPDEAGAAPRQDPAGGAGSHPQALPRSRPAAADAADAALLRAPADEIAASCQRGLRGARGGRRRGIRGERRRLHSQIGSGALPLETLPSAGLAIAPSAAKAAAPALEALAAAFRSLPIPVIGRIKDGALIFDLRCLDDEAGFLRPARQLACIPTREARDAPA